MKRTKRCIYESGQKTQKSKQPYKQGFSNSSLKLEKHPKESKGNTLNSSVPVCLIPANTTESGGAAFPATRR